MDFVEYRAGAWNVVPLILPGGVVLALVIYFSATEPPKTAIGWAALGLFGLLFLTMLVGGVVTLLVTSLKFTTEGMSFRDILTPTLRFSWSDVTEVTVQDVSGRHTLSYRVAVQLKDVEGYLSSVPPSTRKYIEKNTGWLGDGVVFNTGNLRISRTQLEQEFRDRVRGTVRRVDSYAPIRLSPAASPVSSDGSRSVPADRSKQTYRMSIASFMKFVLLGMAVAGMGVYFLLDPQKRPGEDKAAVFFFFVGALFVVAALYNLAILKLEFAPEGVLYRGQRGYPIRVPWDEVAGVHVASFRGGGDSGTVVVVELKDFDSFVHRQGPAAQAYILGQSQRFGKGIALFTQFFPVSASTVASTVLRRAGLSA